MNRSEESFALNKAPHIAEAIAKNAHRLDLDSALSKARRLPVAHVIGAGHTLPPGVPSGRQCIAVNSAVGALRARSVNPGFVLCRESIDMSSQFANLGCSPMATAILDVGVHPKTWDAAEMNCEDVRWFVPASVQTFGIAAALHVEPLYAGQSNVTAAVAAAAFMGATEINLWGCSRAFSAQGRAYADGTGWETVRLAGVENEEDATGPHHVATIEGLEAKAVLHAASGQRAPLKRERVVPVQAVDGSTRWATEPLEQDRQWLENFAARHPHIRCYQHHPDVAIAGWGHAPVKPEARPTVDLMAELRAQCETARQVAHATIDGGRIVEVPGLMGGSDLVDYSAVGERLRIVKTVRDPRRSIPAVMRAWAEMADQVEGWL